MTTRLAIFDCDGTLVDSLHNICLAMDDAFRMNGLAAPDPHRTRRVVGLSLVEAMRAMLPGAPGDLHASLAEDYRTAFQRLAGNGLGPEPLYDGIAELLDALASDGWMLGVATGKSDRGLARCLNSHGIRAHFITLQTADRHPSKPHPAMIEAALAEAGSAPGRAVMIGDTSFDMAMARAARVGAIGVDWGYHDTEELTAAGAHAVAVAAADIPDLLKEEIWTR